MNRDTTTPTGATRTTATIDGRPATAEDQTLAVGDPPDTVDEQPSTVDRRPSTAVLACRGIRGATTAIANTAEDIIEATDEMMRVLIALNDLVPEDVVSAIFTTTPDLTATFPALAAREIGWLEVPLLCSHEMNVPGSLQRCVRVLLHVNTTRSAADVRHVYLKGARQLRPEWAYSDEQIADILRSEGDG